MTTVQLRMFGPRSSDDNRTTRNLHRGVFGLIQILADYASMGLLIYMYLLDVVPMSTHPCPCQVASFEHAGDDSCHRDRLHRPLCISLYPLRLS